MDINIMSILDFEVKYEYGADIEYSYYNTNHLCTRVWVCSDQLVLSS